MESEATILCTPLPKTPSGRELPGKAGGYENTWGGVKILVETSEGEKGSSFKRKCDHRKGFTDSREGHERAT